MTDVKTVFGALGNYRKGGVEVIKDDPKNYVFSNVFEVAEKSKPYERVAVGKNFEYVIEALRAEGASPWYACAHDEFALVMDGKIEVRLVKPDKPVVPVDKVGAIKLDAAPAGRKFARPNKGGRNADVVCRPGLRAGQLLRLPPVQEGQVRVPSRRVFRAYPLAERYAHHGGGRVPARVAARHRLELLLRHG